MFFKADVFFRRMCFLRRMCFKTHGCLPAEVLGIMSGNEAIPKKKSDISRTSTDSLKMRGFRWRMQSKYRISSNLNDNSLKFDSDY